MSDATRRVTLADFGDGPRWIADWCLARKDLDGFVIQVRGSGGRTSQLVVYLYRGDRTASRGWPKFGMEPFSEPQEFIIRDLDRLMTYLPGTDQESTS